MFHPDLTVKMPPNSSQTAANATPALTSLALLEVISCFCNTSVVGRLLHFMTVTGRSANAKASRKCVELEPGKMDVQGLGNPTPFAMDTERVRCL